MHAFTKSEQVQLAHGVCQDLCGVLGFYFVMLIQDGIVEFLIGLLSYQLTRAVLRIFHQINFILKQSNYKSVEIVPSKLSLSAGIAAIRIQKERIFEGRNRHRLP